MASSLNVRTAVLGAALAAFSGCACDSVPSEAIEECAAAQVIPSAVQTDILFVVDDSGSMSEEQANLVDNLAGFVDTLAASAIEIDYRIAVTTTSVEGFQGETTYSGGAEAGKPYPAGAIVADDPGTATAGDLVYDASLYGSTGGWGGLRFLSRGAPQADVDAFKENFRVGTSGSGKEQHFRATRLALSDRIADGVNAGFLRHGSNLAVVFVTDEDDCSDSAAPLVDSNTRCQDATVKQTDLDSVEEFGAFLLGPIGGELREVTVGAITWQPGDDTCTTAYGAGDRFVELAAALGTSRVRTGSVCAADFGSTLAAFAEVLKPTSMPLDGAPADPRMLAVRVTKPDGTPVPCAVAAEGSAEAGAADVLYVAPRLGRPASLTFQNACTLDLGDRVDVQVICAG
jgi:hypothetical protein